MREILFRGVPVEADEDRKLMFVFGMLKAVAPPLNEAIIFVGRGYSGKDVNVFWDTVGQHTGVVDTNGIGIYEGDILQAESGERFAVKFVDGAFLYANEDSICELNSREVKRYALTIVGTAYDKRH